MEISHDKLDFQDCPDVREGIGDKIMPNPPEYIARRIAERKAELEAQQRRDMRQ